ncbi:afadin- and alpha-actinin-binding protein-like isoform X2 [Siniperca chuatsi]|uniref:afadin- and alpha-actinin-binding protein-like isoform X2 n=1 Tax=Siniperca chuatsi TaxID=119488 RepID=UPI001CE170E6|nr:afadin- and alpha-actinin-binding protein-like isoform X2 [Siniperca chuatsi]XP_044055970.1 afadin- and alpha-actinin-binding protein-like isoform X2 [Siniperca chuatsi]XP_044055971.1 afadin- and alpha-actinin-binding protein-like isoform X2 [Siniperca chuatsi]
MPESSLVKDIRSSSVECRTPPLGQFSQSALPLHRKSYMLSTFCTEHNVQECLSHINQEVSSLGLPPVWTESSGGNSEMNVVAVLNCMYDLIQLHRRGLRSLENMEVEQLKSSSNVDYLQLTSTRLKEQLELSKRENTGLLERERQLQLKVKSLQNCLKNEKEEVQKLQNIIASRASQYNHEMKRKEREFNKLKERLNQLLVDKKERKQAIDVLNNIGRADGKRSLWKTEKTEAKHEGEMYKTLLSDYDTRQRELLLENAELKKVLQQMKKDMVSILSSRKPTLNGDKHQDDGRQVDSEEEEEVFDSSKESMELYCVHAREKLTNSIRLQWRRLKSHVERLDSQASLAQMGGSKNADAVSRETHEEEMDRLKLEIQQCKDFIQTQQQLLQQQLSSPCDEETASLLSDCYMLQEKEHLREEWKTLEEQRKIFERERRNFTEAAIRLSHERKAFEEDRATWLKHQFLNLSPFADSKKPQMSKSKSAFLISETKSVSAPEKLIKCPSDTTSPSPRWVPLTSPSTADLYRTLCLFPENSSTKPKRETEHVEESKIFLNGNVSVQHKQWNDSEGHSSHTLTKEKNSSI